jgi:hypothetical protein
MPYRRWSASVGWSTWITLAMPGDRRLLSSPQQAGPAFQVSFTARQRSVVRGQVHDPLSAAKPVPWRIRSPIE